MTCEVESSASTYICVTLNLINNVSSTYVVYILFIKQFLRKGPTYKVIYTVNVYKFLKENEFVKLNVCII